MKFISCLEKRNDSNRLIRRYKIYNFLLFKIKKKVLPVLGKNNKIIIGGRELTENDKKFLDKAGKITIEGNNNIVELTDVYDLSCDICIKGDNNRVCIGRNQTKISKISLNNKITIEGNNNIIEQADINFLNCNTLITGNNNKVCIGKFRYPTFITVMMHENFDNRELIIDDSLFFTSVTFCVIGNERKVHVGKNCMFSGGIKIWTTDYHPIYDVATNKRVNEDKDIMIGDNVWVGAENWITKGSVIPSGCVIGAQSFVNKAFTKENCIIAGSPANVVKENIYWKLR